MTIGLYSFELHLPQARSLKNKRQVVRGIKDRLRSRYNVALIELSDYADLWQRAALAVVSIAESREPLERLFEAVRREVESQLPGHLIESGKEFLEG